MYSDIQPWKHAIALWADLSWVKDRSEERGHLGQSHNFSIELLLEISYHFHKIYQNPYIFLSYILNFLWVTWTFNYRSGSFAIRITFLLQDENAFSYTPSSHNLRLVTIFYHLHAYLLGACHSPSICNFSGFQGKVETSIFWLLTDGKWYLTTFLDLIMNINCFHNLSKLTTHSATWRSLLLWLVFRSGNWPRGDAGSIKPTVFKLIFWNNMIKRVVEDLKEAQNFFLSSTFLSWHSMDCLLSSYGRTGLESLF